MDNLESPQMQNFKPLKGRRQRRHNFFKTLQHSEMSNAAPIVAVGQRLRDARLEKGLTIRDLAKNSGLNVNTLSMIENSKTLPSLETLQQLSFALEMPIATFFEEITPENKIVHFKADQRTIVEFAHGMLEDLGAGMPRRGVETFLVTLKPNCNSGDHWMVHTGCEIVFCLEGQLTYTIEDGVFTLSPGDSLFFDAHIPHRWQNKAAKLTRALLVLCPSDEQDRPEERHFTQEVRRIRGKGKTGV